MSNSLKYLELLRDLSPNIGIMPQLHSKYLGESLIRRKCYICSDRLDLIISELLSKAINELKNVRVGSFVVSVPRGSKLEERELEVISEFKLDSWESIRRELKRELGKKISSTLGIEPDFRHPDVVVMVNPDTLDVSIYVTPTYVYGKYVKVGRYISQMKLVTDGVRRYALSLEDVVEVLANSLNASNYKIHAAGREDADVRVLGNGMPLLIEFRGVRDKTLDVDDIVRLVPRSEWLTLGLEKVVTPKYAYGVKVRKFLKVYRLLILSKKPLSVDSMKVLEREFSGRDVRQRTPTRVLRRRRDVVKVKKVYGVAARAVDEYLIEALVKCDSGLYIKELVHGDLGRTTPSFAEVLGTELAVLEVDVLEVLPTSHR